MPIGRRLRWTTSVYWLLSLAILGCPERTAVWIERDSTAERLVFGLGKTPHGPRLDQLVFMAVRPCRDGKAAPAMWAIQLDVPDAPPPRTIVYGQVPAGYTVVDGPANLPPGCFDVAISGSGRQRFTVRPDRRIEVNGKLM